MDFPLEVLEPCVIVHPWSLESMGGILRAVGGSHSGTLASAVYPAVDKALFFPFTLGKSVTALSFLWLNGAVVSGNIDVGIYTEDGTLLYGLGATAQAGVNTFQFIPLIAPGLTFGPGTFYLAICMNNTTGALMRGLANTAGTLPQVKSSLGAAEMDAAFRLPPTVTLVSLTVDYIPMFGFTTRTLI